MFAVVALLATADLAAAGFAAVAVFAHETLNKMHKNGHCKKKLPIIDSRMS